MTKGENVSVDIIIPTYKPGEEFGDFLNHLALQRQKINRIFIINTEEKYWNKEFERNIPNLSVTHIKKSQFDHGAIRDDAVRKSQGNIVVFMTQDAYPVNDNLIGELIAPILKGEAALSFGRQIPNKDAGEIEQFTREFNYPPESFIKGREDLKTLGIKTYFFSNVCSAADRMVYERVGGFPGKAILNEDMVLAYRAIKSGYKIAYQADAQVYHSHNYSALKQMKRNFDIGVSQKQNPEIFQGISSVGEGKKLVKDTAKHLFKIHKPYLIFKLIWVSAFKYLGFALGKRYDSLPMTLVKKLSSNSDYWEEKYE